MPRKVSLPKKASPGKLTLTQARAAVHATFKFDARGRIIVPKLTEELREKYLGHFGDTVRTVKVKTKSKGSTKAKRAKRNRAAA